MKAIRFTLFLLIFFALSACEKEKAPIAATVDQTVLMYLPWATDLLSYFQTNISDMESAIAGDILKKERVIVLLSTSSTKAELFELKYQNGKCIRIPLKSYTSPALTTAGWITSMLEDVKTFAPAYRYGMTIGCHGMGWIPVQAMSKARSSSEKYHWEYEGAIKTRFFGGRSSEFQTEVSALAQGITNAGIKMEYILFDDCYMSSIEVAYELRNVTDYLIASPTEIMVFGMPYTDIGPHLVGKVDYDAICKAFLDFYRNYQMPYGTIGVTACRELDPLAGVMKEINTACTFDTSLRASIQPLDGYTPVLFFDYGDYVTKLSNKRPDLLEKFKLQLERTVPYKQHTDYYFTGNFSRKIKVNTYSGITTSDPSLHSFAATKKETLWYQATH